MCGDVTRKANAQLELNLARHAKNNKGFNRYVGQKRKIEYTLSKFVDDTKVSSKDYMLEGKGCHPEGP